MAFQALLLPRWVHPSAMSSLPTVLIFTYAEYGQANVNLATSYELALAGADVYIASFASLTTRVSRLQELILRHTSHGGDGPIGSVDFLECKGFASWEEAIGKHGMTIPGFRHPHGVWGALEGYSKFDVGMCPWGQEEYVAAIESCKGIVATIKPNMVVIDILFYAAMDACDLLEQKFMTILPNSIMDIAAGLQPYYAALWKYPMCVARFVFGFLLFGSCSFSPSISSGFSYPLKWWQIPLNVYLNIRLIVRALTSAHMNQFLALRRSLGITSAIGTIFRPGMTYICSALAETDFPFAAIPEEIHLCGPIIVPFDPLEESDPVLMKWLDNGPTVMINLGSHVLADEKIAMEIAGAIRILLVHHEKKGTSRMQVLWKAKASGNIENAIRDVVGQEIEEGRVKVLAWLSAEPVSILQHPNVVCTVHHGGANSYYEGIW